MDRDFSVIIERDAEGYYVASVPKFPGCHTQARSVEEVSERITEAVKLYPGTEQCGLTMRWYDEEFELWRYLQRNFTHLMTDFELRAGLAAIVREKAATSNNETIARMLSERWGVFAPEFDSAFSAGWQAFRRSVCRRIQEEQGEAIIERCPQCRRVLRTPRARQCLWCGHDWHGTPV